jgi:hypothetical protein
VRGVKGENNVRKQYGLFVVVPQVTERGGVPLDNCRLFITPEVSSHLHQRQWPPTPFSQVRETLVFVAVDTRPDMSVN